MAVFAGGASLEAIAAVADNDETDILEGLEALLDHNLVRQLATSGEPRFAMLETIREFGLDQMIRHGESDQIHQRHAAYVLTSVEAADLDGPAQDFWLATLQVEHNNIRGALSWALAHDPPLALRLAAPLPRFWSTLGYMREGLGWLERALDTAGDTDSAVRARAHLGASGLAWEQGDLPRAREHGDRALSWYRNAGDELGIARTLNNLGNLALGQDDQDQANAYYEESLEIGRRLGNDDCIANASLNLGNVVAFQGDIVRCVALYQEALDAWVRSGNRSGQAFARCNLGVTALYDQSDPDAAIRYFQESLVDRWDLGDMRGIADCLAGLAGCAERTGQLQRSARLYGATDGLRNDIGAWVIPQMRALEDAISTAVREAMGSQAFAESFAAGGALSLEQAVEEAKNGADPDPPARTRA